MKSKDNKNNFNLFFNAHWVMLVLILCSFIVIGILSAYYFPKLINKKSLEDDISKISNLEPVFSLSKIIFYSSASGINNNENKSNWNLNISQYTDIALYLNIINKDSSNDSNLGIDVIKLTDKNSISKLYIDNISFSNNETGKLSLNYNPFVNFSKLSDDELTSEKVQPNTISFNILDSSNPILDDSNIYSNAVIDESLSVPITLRYFNKNLKTNHIINTIEQPLYFNGSILRSSGIPLYSIKNTVSFDIHIINKLNEEFVLHVSFEIPLQEDRKSVV